MAIIGMAGRFPGAKNLGEFWRNLRDGVESISFFTTEELRAEGVEPAELSDANYVPAKAVLEDVELFDASFFDYNPREAEMLDPQLRVMLECAVEAFEDAGYDPERVTGRVSVYAGVSAGSYLTFNLASRPDLVERVGPYQVDIGNHGEFVPTTISFKLNLKGPSINVQTACSTSLVAVHAACQSLLNGESDVALAGGGSITFPHKAGHLYQEEGIMSPDGHCRAFDEHARGTVSGEGAGLVVLKRLTDALADGDTIHAVIKGSAVNNDGSLKVGFTAPSIDGQADVIAEALAMAGVDAETIGYVETHGTGTPLGDPIEIAALTQAYRASTQRRGFCAIGSLKSNIGHLDAGAGIAGLIKAALALKHKEIPPSLHYERPNPKIDFEKSPFFVNARLRPWEAGATPRRAGVSSFGIGGTNAHVILEEAPPPDEFDAARSSQLLVLSAKTSTALDAATKNLGEYLRTHPEANLSDVAYTLQVGRREFAHRRALVARDAADAAGALEAHDPHRLVTSFQEPRHRPNVFMFPGQGAQYAGMSQGLYESEPLFREQVDRLAELLLPRLGLDLRAVLYPTPEGTEEATQLLKQTFITQPALFVVEY
ncbi:MAG TPA: type I polyketide synthase, partial [Pyrinomonadaceae bacterium]